MHFGKGGKQGWAKYLGFMLGGREGKLVDAELE